jgi:hypothetical membrane protein
LKYLATGILGAATTVWFWAALIIFGALDPAYEQTTKAVSELGVIGAKNASLWNALGFGLTGLMLAIFGYRAAKILAPRRIIARWTLTLSGLAFMAAAIPADMSDLSSPGSQAHIAASILNGALWFVGATMLLGKKIAFARQYNAITIVLLAAMIGSLVLRGADIVLPGLAQRISFAIYFAWFFAVSLVFMTNRSVRDE